MSKPKKNQEQLEEMELGRTNYHSQFSRLQLEIFKLELKPEKLREQIIFQFLKEKGVAE